VSATAEHPARVLFDSNFNPGLLTSLVLEEWRKEPDITVDGSTLHQVYVGRSCTNAAKLVDFFVSYEKGGRIQTFGSGSIDIDGSTRGEFTWEKAMRFQELYIGIKRYRISPLQWLAYLARRIDDVPENLLPAFDMVMGEFLKILTLPTSRYLILKRRRNDFDDD